jgi:hypothetical protein
MTMGRNSYRRHNRRGERNGCGSTTSQSGRSGQLDRDARQEPHGAGPSGPAEHSGRKQHG